VEVARYLHLNPVRIGGLGLSKQDQRRARVVGCENPGEAVKRFGQALPEDPKRQRFVAALQRDMSTT
jgi:hypothetical protein